MRKPPDAYLPDSYSLLRLDAGLIVPVDVISFYLSTRQDTLGLTPTLGIAFAPPRADASRAGERLDPYLTRTEAPCRPK